MSTSRRVLRPILVRVLGEAGTRRVARAYTDGRSNLEYRVYEDGRRSTGALRAFRDRHQGERCFIIGNGPSLANMDLSPLRGEVTFGLNRLYLLFERMGFPTSYLVSVNRLVIEQCADEMVELTLPLFLSWSSRQFIRDRSRAVFLRSVGRPHFSTDPTAGVWEGATVTFVALQLAYYMGIRKVILIGVDHSFATKGPAHQLVTSTGDDPNHFDSSYFGKGFRWNLPDLELSEKAYEMARRAFAADGREIVDATVGGHLEVFPKTRFEDLFAGATS
jgi:hypothetical protein